jgi:hypothetical protein
MTPKPAAKQRTPEEMATGATLSPEASEDPTTTAVTNDQRAADMANEGPASEPTTDSAPDPEAPAKRAPEPPQHCPVCGLEMVVEAGYWVCSDQKCGTRLPHEYHPAEEISSQL